MKKQKKPSNENWGNVLCTKEILEENNVATCSKSEGSNRPRKKVKLSNEVETHSDGPQITSQSINAAKPINALNKMATPDNGRENIPFLLLKNGEKWFDKLSEIAEPQLVSPTKHNSSPGQAKSLEALEEKAISILRGNSERYHQWYRTHNPSEAKWLETVQRSGTFADKISALQLRFQRSPLQSLDQLGTVIDALHSKGIRESHSLLKVLQEVFLDNLIPPHRKLVSFNQRSIDPKWTNHSSVSNDTQLLVWAFESELKKCYRHFIQALENLAGNAVEGVAKSACSSLAHLLIERSEQEQVLLTSLVNKLGHPHKQVGSHICQLLEQLIQKHPNMRLVVATEIEQLVFRKNVGHKAHLYAVHCLSRIHLKAGEWELATKLVQIYLNLFRCMLTEKNVAVQNNTRKKQNRKNEKSTNSESDPQPWNRILPLLITGLNRAFPYLKGRADELVEEMDSLYSIVQTSKFTTSLRVLRLLFQIHSKAEGLPDRFYCSLYRWMLNVDAASSVSSLFFDLLAQVMKHDTVECRIRAFIKRLLQLALTGTPSFAAASLLAVYQVARERPTVLIITSKTAVGAVDLSKDDRRAKKNKHHTKNNVKEEINETITSGHSVFDDDSDEEHYEDVIEDDSKEVKPDISHKICGWTWRSPASASPLGSTPGSSKAKRDPTSYDPLARNPLFAGAEYIADTELFTLAKHYHPSVSRFATCIIKGQPIEYNGDPLVDFNSIRFLDRFAFKNPKKKEAKRSTDGQELDEEGDMSDQEFEQLMDKRFGSTWKNDSTGTKSGSESEENDLYDDVDMDEGEEEGGGEDDEEGDISDSEG